MSKRIPKYRHHEPSGRAVVTLDGHDRYLGKHGTPESRTEYDRLIAEWLAHGRQPPQRQAARGGVSLYEVIDAYWQHAQTYYRHRDGTPTGEVDAMLLV